MASYDVRVLVLVIDSYSAFAAHVTLGDGLS